ncbi:MAG: hypothetical protein ABIA04_15415 [Pseudomonadota bacterium]
MENILIVLAITIPISFAIYMGIKHAPNMKNLSDDERVQLLQMFKDSQMQGIEKAKLDELYRTRRILEKDRIENYTRNIGNNNNLGK